MVENQQGIEKLLLLSLLLLITIQNLEPDSLWELHYLFRQQA